MKTLKNHRQKIINGGIALLVVVVVVVALVFFVRSIRRTITDETRHYLTEMSEQNALLVQNKFEGGVNELRAISSVISAMDVEIDAPQVIGALQRVQSSSDFQNMAIEDPNGKAYNVNLDVHYDVTQTAYFKQAISGKEFIGIIQTRDTNENAILIAVPIFRDNEVIGVIAGRYYSDSVMGILNIDAFGGQGYSYLANKDGLVFASSDNPLADKGMGDVEAGMKDVAFKSPEMLQAMLEGMAAGQSGVVEYHHNDTNRIMNYTPIALNDWYLLSVVPEGIIQKKSISLFFRAAMVFGVIMVVAAIVMAYIYNQGNRRSVALKKANKEIEASQVRYDMIMSQCQEVVFEWNIQEDTIFHSKYYKEKFGQDPVVSNFPQSIHERGIIAEPDIPVFDQMFVDIVKQACFLEREMRVVNGSGDWLWCRVRAVSIADDSGLVYRVIGVLSDIDFEKRELERITDAARRDSLTNLYNKGTSESVIDDWLDHNSGQWAALFIMDIDDFKHINDTWGHAAGDKVLRDVAACLLKTMGKDNIVGRIGGDEFVALYKKNEDGRTTKDVANALVHGFDDYLIADEKPLSVSIGVAVFPKDGNDFKALYKKADQGLYQAKNRGKNQYQIYEG